MIRPLDRCAPEELAQVADRMRLTLIEVLGAPVGADMYSIEWLRERVRWHLDASAVLGEVLVAEIEGGVRGHTLLRIEVDENGERTGLFATTYVEPEWRRRGVGRALLQRGEAWLVAHDPSWLATHTSATNRPLIELFERQGYEIVLEDTERGMVRLARRV